MIEISNLRKYQGGITRVEADITFTDMDSPYSERTLYFEIDKEHGDMFADDSYDAFVLVPLWLAMFHKQDLHISGRISKKLYQNIKWYVQKIWCDYWDEFSPVKFTVDGFNEPLKERGKIIGAGISCGVDSLSTVYDHFIRETDPEYRINALFYFDCGIFGDFGQESWDSLTLNRSNPGRNVAKDLYLPFYYVGSNLHAFRKMNDLIRFNYIAVYSCVLSLSKGLSRYYIANNVSYEEMKEFRNHFHNGDMGEFCESYFVPLLQNERMDLIIDGCQYRRVDKTKNIVDWEIAQKYLNVCWRYTPDGSNCGKCPKCFRTILTLEILGKLEKFSNVFDIEAYKKDSMNYKIYSVMHADEEVFFKEIVDLAKEMNFPMPTKREGYLLDGQISLI